MANEENGRAKGTAWGLQPGHFELRNESILLLLNAAALGTLAVAPDGLPLALSVPYVFRAGRVFACVAPHFSQAVRCENGDPVCFHVLGASSCGAPEAPCPCVNVYGHIAPVDESERSTVYAMLNKKYKNTGILPEGSSQPQLLCVSGERICGSGLLPE